MPVESKPNYSDAELAAKQAKLASEGEFGVSLGEALKEQKYRKLNRIASNLDKLKHNDPQLEKVSAALNAALNEKVKNPSAEPDWAETKAAMREVFSDDGKKPSDLQKQNRGIMLPLNQWINDKGTPDPEVEKGLREYRLDVQRNDEMIPVAIHRGDGPTFKTMGIEIPKNNHKFTNFQAENTSAAFEKAREQMYGERAAGKSRVNGLETDVFLTHDGEVVLTHDADLEVQLDDASRTKEVAAREARIADPELAEKLKKEGRLDAFSKEVTTFQMRRKESLDGMQVREKSETKFIGLKTFMEKINHAGNEHLAETQKLAKAEIEMKGHYSAGPGDNPYQLAEGRSEERKQLERDYKAKLKQAVTKELSQANKKALAGFSGDKSQPMNAVPVRVALFNGSFEDAQKFDQARRTKTSLFNVQVGAGLKPNQLEELSSPTYAALDEVRVSSSALEDIHKKLPARASRDDPTAELAPHITFVSGGDRLPPDAAMTAAQKRAAEIKSEFGNIDNKLKKVKAADPLKATLEAAKAEKSALDLDLKAPAKLDQNQRVTAYHQQVNPNVSLLIDSSANVALTRTPTVQQTKDILNLPRPDSGPKARS